MLQMISKMIIYLIFIPLITTGCYFFEFFQDDSEGGGGVEGLTTGSTQPVLGGDIGPVAGTQDDTALQAVYDVSSTGAPAAVRPDPDLYVRRLLRQFREESSTLARQIGNVEGFRLLLGGASVDFQKMPQSEYDATSLLASLSVAETVCEGLVAPVEWEHPGWVTILPYEANDWSGNIRFLIQRITGRPSARIEQSAVDQLKAILDDHMEDTNAPIANGDYVPVCAVLALDAEALLL